MIAERDVLIGANALLKNFGAEALEHAAEMIDKRIKEGNSDGYILWVRIHAAIRHLTKKAA